jgi:hypothetical protein
MRVAYARSPKGAPAFIVDRRGRARAARAAIVSPKAAGLALACALLAVAPETGPGARLVAAGQSAAKSAADYIRARSPGRRQRADLVKIKHPRAAPRVARAAPKHRRPAPRPVEALIAPPPSAVPLSFANAALAPTYQPVFAGPLPMLGDSPVPCCFEGFNPPLFTGGGGFTIGGGGGGGPGGTVPGTPGIPEPRTWVMMILGFGAIGAAWRRRRMLLQALKALPRLMHQRMLLLTHARS